MQILSFTSTGGQAHFNLPHTYVTHGLRVHITVIAVNGAGLKQAVYSDPLVIDLTQPNITSFQVCVHEIRNNNISITVASFIQNK